MKRDKPLLCRDCRLYDKINRLCKVVIYMENEKYELSTKPNDECVWEKEGIPVQEIRAWSDGEDGYISVTEQTCPEEDK